MDDRDRMERRPMWIPWAVAAFALLFLAFVMFAAGMRTISFDGDHFAHDWHGPGLFVGIFMMFLVFGILRRMFWWGGGYPYGRPWRYRRYYRYFGDPYEDDREWEERHRRAHERMDERSRGASSPSPEDGSYRRD